MNHHLRPRHRFRRPSHRRPAGCDGGDGGDVVTTARAGAVASAVGYPAVRGRSSDALPRCT